MKSLLIFVTCLYSVSGFKIYNNVLTLHDDIEGSKGIAAADSAVPVIFTNHPSNSDNPVAGEITDVVIAARVSEPLKSNTSESALESTSVSDFPDQREAQTDTNVSKVLSDDNSRVPNITSETDFAFHSPSTAKLNLSATTSSSISQIEEYSTASLESAKDSAEPSISTESSVSESVNGSTAIYGSVVTSTIAPESQKDSTVTSQPATVVSSSSSTIEATSTSSTHSVNASSSDSATESTSPIRSAVTSLTESTNLEPINLPNTIKDKENLPDSAIRSTSSTESVMTTTIPTDLTTDFELQTTTEDLSFLSQELLPPKTEYQKNEPDPRYDY